MLDDDGDIGVELGGAFMPDAPSEECGTFWSTRFFDSSEGMAVKS